MTDNNQNINDDEYEKICFVCRRPESKTGKQVTMPGGITICPDCMQRTFDAIEHNSLNGGMDLNDVALNSLIFGNSNNSGGGTNSTKETSNTASMSLQIQRIMKILLLKIQMLSMAERTKRKKTKARIETDSII